MQAIRTQDPTTMAQVRPMIESDVAFDLRIAEYHYQEGIRSFWPVSRSEQEQWFLDMRACKRLYPSAFCLHIQGIYWAGVHMSW
jgi:hypothetical protein